ncbi:hypothetical protein AK812_SmicGene24340 [Symbiodinium microadriaticum]|uniref:Uncharacterized protein n=1 Tax=Symbiodinium microadriaticum TaxID=2951 RepID=A0A1Q9DEZ1_SYMMI|nr:hypothetical protein AK812_SmicGene24340 [Symbiodinium microadriaticum]
MAHEDRTLMELSGGSFACPQGSDRKFPGYPEKKLVSAESSYDLKSKSRRRKSHLVASLAALLWMLAMKMLLFLLLQRGDGMMMVVVMVMVVMVAAEKKTMMSKLGHLVPELCTEDDCEMLSEDLPQAEGSAMSDTSLAAGRLLTVLLAPYLSLGTTSLQLLEFRRTLASDFAIYLCVKPGDLCLASASLHSGHRPDTFMAWLVLGAALRASGSKGAELEEVGRAVTRAAALPERAAFATEALGQATRALRGAAAQSMAYTGADEEWRWLKEDGAAELGSALGWLLATVEDAEDAKDVLLSAVVLEYLEGCRLRQVAESGSTSEILCEPGDWAWLSQCLPSPMWMAQRVEVLLGHALQVHIDGLTMHSRAAAGGMLALMTTCLAESKAAGAMVSNHVVAGIAMKWQQSAMSEACLEAGEARLVECIALFLLQQLASAPSSALQRSPLLAIVLETLQCKQKVAVLATEVAAVALFRAWDVAQLRDLAAPSHALVKRLMTTVEQGLVAQAGCLPHDGLTGWAMISSWLLLLGAEGPTSAPRGPGLTLKPRSFQDWTQALDGHHSVVAFQLLALSTACLRGARAAQLLIQVDDLQDLPMLVRACADLIGASADGDPRGWGTAASESALLAMVGLLTLELLPPLARSEALHAERVEASLRLGLSRLFGEASREGLEDATVVEDVKTKSRGEDGPRWLSSPALLFFLLLLRSSPGWLFAGEGALLLKLESSLAEHLRSSDGEGARTLLLLRLAEELLFLEASSACHQAVLRQLVADQKIWDQAVLDVRAISCQEGNGGNGGAGDDEEVANSDDVSDEDMDLLSLGQQATKLRLEKGHSLPPSSSNLACLRHLHHASVTRLCGSLAQITGVRR